MKQPITRSRFVRLTAAAAGIGAASAGRVRAADQVFNYKLSNTAPADQPLNVRLTQMFDDVRKETKGRLNVQIFPNGALGSETSLLSQLRSGGIQFMTTGTGVSSVVPEVTLPQVGFAFNSVKAGLAAYDGALGVFVRAAMEKKGIFGFQYVYDIGMRVITSSSKPIRTPEDLDGFKLRTPGEHVSLDLFAAFGASPTPMTYDQLYTALQTHLVDGQETPYQSIYFGKLYEVQKYLAVSNHQYTAFYLLSNTEVIAGLPPDIKASLMRNAQKYAMLERQDNERLNRTYVQQLKDKGMAFNDIDSAAMRKRLTAYYAKYRSEFGSVAWDALQRAAGATLA